MRTGANGGGGIPPRPNEKEETEMRKTPTALASAAVLALGAGGLTQSDARAAEVTIATVNNSDMIVMQRLSDRWEEQTGHTLDWVVLEENTLRQRVTTDIAAGGGQFDIMTIGTYEVPIWGERGWLVPLDDFDKSYDYNDLVDTVRNGLSVDGTMMAAPFYAESSFTFYRTDLFEEAGLTMPDQPTYEQIYEFATQLHAPKNDVYGICLRGKPGWGENMAYVSTLVNTYGGRWFDMDWEPQLTSEPWKAAINFYVDLLGNYGPPGAASNGHNENRALFATGKCAMWVDATSAAGFIYNPDESQVADVTGFAQAPVEDTEKGSAWSWSWALGVPSSSKNQQAAKSFIQWATSKEYIELVGETEGWVSAPPGTRESTYERAAYQEAAPFADFVIEAIRNADPTDATAQPVPYTGVQFVAIPEFQGIGTVVGQQISAALSGAISAEQALENAQRSTRRSMQRAGYYD